MDKRSLSQYIFTVSYLLVDCTWDDWSAWSSCSITCGTGTVTRNRVIKTHEENGGSECTGDSTETSQLSCGTCAAGLLPTLFYLLPTAQISFQITYSF